MSRKAEFQKQSPNPASRFLEWKSDKQCFQYWDKEAQKNVEVPLPVKFLVLKEMHTVKGFHDASQSGIASNEVVRIGDEPLKVYSFKGGEIANGLYSQIRTEVRDAGGYYVKSIYAMTEDGEIVNFQLKGSAVSEWSDFTQKTRSRLFDEWVEVYEAETKKKGRVEYSVPKFRFSGSATNAQSDKAEEVYGILKTYMDAYLALKEEERDETPNRENSEVDKYNDKYNDTEEADFNL